MVVQISVIKCTFSQQNDFHVSCGVKLHMTRHTVSAMSLFSIHYGRLHYPCYHQQKKGL